MMLSSTLLFLERVAVDCIFSIFRYQRKLQHVQDFFLNKKEQKNKKNGKPSFGTLVTTSSLSSLTLLNGGLKVP